MRRSDLVAERMIMTKSKRPFLVEISRLASEAKDIQEYAAKYSQNPLERSRARGMIEILNQIIAKATDETTTRS